MKKLIAFGTFLTLAVLTWTSCSTNFFGGEKKVKDTVYAINGKLENLPMGMINLEYRFDGKGFSDSARIENGEFHFKGKVDGPHRAYLTLQVGEEYQEVVFFLDNGTTTVTGRADSLVGAKVAGTAVQDEFIAYSKEMKSFDDRMAAFEATYQSVSQANSNTMDSLLDVYAQITTDKLFAIDKYVEGHPESFVAATEVLNNFAYDPDARQLDSIYNFFAPSIKSSLVGQKINEMVVTAKKTAVGQVAPDFTLNDPHDKPKALSSLRGKVLLVDFWASWCGPCREENPNVVSAYKKYHSKGFDILGVSLDSKREKWLAAIDEDGLKWNHVSDLKGWKSAAGELYGIRSIPMSYLLDKEGRIVAKNLRGSGLTKKLDELLK